MILVQIPINVIQLISELENSQPTIFRRVAPYLQAAFLQGLPEDQLALIKLLNENLGTLVLPEFTLHESAEIWLKALRNMPAQLGSNNNPHPITIH